MRLSETLGRQVVSTASAATVGSIHELVIDPQTAAVVAMILKKTDDGDTLRWSDIVAFGADAVTVTGADKLTSTPPEIADLHRKTHRIMGKRVLTSAGDELGTVADVEFDPDTGGVTALVLGDGRVAGGRLVGAGSYAVVVRDE